MGNDPGEGLEMVGPAPRKPVMGYAQKCLAASVFRAERAEMELPGGAPAQTWIRDVGLPTIVKYLASHGAFAPNVSAFALRPLIELAYGLPLDHPMRDQLIAQHDEHWEHVWEQHNKKMQDHRGRYTFCP